jgi:RHS repeat-associated protein
MQVFAPDGTLVYDNTNDQYSTEYPVDTNGNFLSYANGSQPDMLGRSTLKPPNGPPCPAYPSSIPQTYTNTYTVRVSDGSTATYTYTCSAGNVAQIVGSTQEVATASFLTSLVLSDGTSYSFSYDTGSTGLHLGNLLSVTLPTGGTVSFTHVPGPVYLGQFDSGRVQSVTFGGGDWNLSYVQTPNSLQVTTTVLSPPRYDSPSKTYISDKTVFTSVPNNSSPVQTAQYYSGSSTLLKTVSYGYDSYLLPLTVTTALNDTGQSSSVSYQYLNEMRNYPTQKQETDFSGSVVRTTVTQYQGVPLRPTSVNVYPGSNTGGTPISSTLYTYDEYSANYCKNNVPGLTNITGATNHDDSGHGIGFTARGNVTTIRRLISGTAYSTTHKCYDTLGNVTQTVDANGNPTTYNYSDSGKWADTDCIPSGTVTDAFPTTITDALGFQSKYTYFTCSSMKQSEADQNQINAQKNTNYTYDEFARALTVNYPDSGQTTYCYSDEAGSPCYSTALPPFSTQSTLISGSSYLTRKTLLDGYNRVVETQLTSDPECSSADKTDTTYDAFGRVLSLSNPYCTTSDPTYGVTTYAYDTLGRTTSITAQDGSVTTSLYSGNTTTVTDPAGKKRQSTTDALGRLTQVTEDPGGLGYVTTYSYDALNDLTNVVQNGSRQRSFSYDSLSRLTKAVNPESGTVNYTYDANSNLLTKQDARSITTTYTYDALNRITQKSYSDGTTPTATFTYDISSLRGVTIQNPIGRLVTVDTSSATSYSYIMRSYDPMGRVTTQWQWFPARAAQEDYAFSVYADYNLVGSPTVFSNETNWFYPQYDTAARVIQLTTNLNDSQHPGTLATTDPSVGYYPNGALRKLTLGNGLTQAISLQPRLQPCRVNLNSSGSYITDVCADGSISGTIQDFDFAYGSSSATNNGNLTSMDASGTQNFARSYTYDSLNRIATMSAPGDSCSGLSWTFDAWGNRTSQTATGGSCYQQPVTTFSPSNQFPLPDQYDAAGNMTYDGTHTYFYDAENNLTQVDGTLGNCSKATACYLYDAEGHRVQKTASGITTAYVYDIFTNQVLEETNGSDTMQVGYVYLSGQPIAEYSGGTTYFVHTDHLGSTRLLTAYPWVSTSQSIADNLDYLPYGELISRDSGIDTHKFTGKERDSESGLDHFQFRNFASTMGRWMSPDPINLTAKRLVNPANTLNKYIYGGNNPLLYTDPTGQDITVFYRAPGGGGQDFGHILLAVTNQATGAVRFADYYPKGNKPGFGPAPGEMNQNETADRLKQHAALTIQTSPEVAQKLIDAIDAISPPNGAPDYWLPTSSCVNICTDLLNLAGIDPPSPFATPTDVWSYLYGNYSAEALQGGQLKMGLYRYQAGRDFGNPMSAFPKGTDPFYNLQLLYLLANQQRQQPQRACTTIQGPNGPETNCVD